MHQFDIETMLHLPYKTFPCMDANCLPLYLRCAYDIFEMQIETTVFLVAQPKQKTSLKNLLVDYKAFTREAGKECTFVLDHPTDYQKKRMVECGVPFICPGREIYLLFWKPYCLLIEKTVLKVSLGFLL